MPSPGGDLGPSTDLTRSLIDLATSSDGGPPLFAELSFSGCPSLDASGSLPRCSGTAPLVLRMVPLTSTAFDTIVWTLTGAIMPTSHEVNPTGTWTKPGKYDVSLVVQGPTGSAMAGGEVVVLAAPTGAACNDDSQCASGSQCLCAPGDGGACPGVLAGGLCSHRCDTSSCAPTEECIDLTASAAGDPALAAQPWRQRVCLQACQSSGECRGGFACRALPANGGGWRSACFPSALLGDVGAPCRDANGQLAPSACTSGVCADLGARGMCTASCASSSCPASATCASFSDDLSHPVCIPRCDPMNPCSDPLLLCQGPNASGRLGFTVDPAAPSDGMWCAPRRCTRASDCSPAGTCDTSPPVAPPDAAMMADAALAPDDSGPPSDAAMAVDAGDADADTSADAGAPPDLGAVVDASTNETSASSDASAHADLAMAPVDATAAPDARPASDGGTTTDAAVTIGFCKRTP